MICMSPQPQEKMLLVEEIAPVEAKPIEIEKDPLGAQPVEAKPIEVEPDCEEEVTQWRREV